MKSNNARRIGDVFSSLDFFSFNPVYEYSTHSSYTGAICSCSAIILLLLYIIISTKDFISQAPELVKQGSVALPSTPNEVVFAPPPIAILIDYPEQVRDESSGKNITKKQKVNFTNSDPYFRYKFTSRKTINSVQGPSTDIPGARCSWDTHEQFICPDEEILNKQIMQGTFGLPIYQFIEVKILKCDNRIDTGCASKEEIDSMINTGDVKISLKTIEELFYTSRFHNKEKGGYENNKKLGVNLNTQRWRFYALPDRKQSTEVYFQGRKINVEHRYLGSPPIAEQSIDIISLHNLATTYKKPSSIKTDTLVSFYFRLDPQISEEEVQYWIRTLLDLFGNWGALASFLTVCSFGIIGNWYNRWRFKSKFHVETSTSTGLSKFLSKSKLEGNTFKDIRLFNRTDFNEEGRLTLTKEEFYFPSTAYGEVRKSALLEHIRKRKAANHIINWYKYHSHRRKEHMRSFGVKTLLDGFGKKRHDELDFIEDLREKGEAGNISLKTLGSARVQYSFLNNENI